MSYLIAPPVSPRTIDLWENNTRITIGIVIVTPTAMINSQGFSQGEYPAYISVMATLSVFAEGEVVNESGYSRSFQALTKLMSPIVTNPGTVTGSRIWQTAMSCEDTDQKVPVASRWQASA